MRGIEAGVNLDLRQCRVREVALSRATYGVAGTVCVCVVCVQVTGLKGLNYLDKSKDPNNPDKKTEDRDAVTFGEALVDSVYLSAPEHVELEVGTGERGRQGGTHKCAAVGVRVRARACMCACACVPCFLTQNSLRAFTVCGMGWRGIL